MKQLGQENREQSKRLIMKKYKMFVYTSFDCTNLLSRGKYLHNLYVWWYAWYEYRRNNIDI